MFLRILTAWAFRSSLGKGNSLPEVWVTSSKNACSAFRKASLSFGRRSQSCTVACTIRKACSQHMQRANSHRCCQASGIRVDTSKQGVGLTHNMAKQVAVWQSCDGLKYQQKMVIYHGIGEVHPSQSSPPQFLENSGNPAPRNSKMLCIMPGVINVTAGCQCFFHPNCICE